MAIFGLDLPFDVLHAPLCVDVMVLCVCTPKNGTLQCEGDRLRLQAAEHWTNAGYGCILSVYYFHGINFCGQLSILTANNLLYFNSNGANALGIADKTAQYEPAIQTKYVCADYFGKPFVFRLFDCICLYCFDIFFFLKGKC